MTRVNWRIDKLILSVYTGPVKASITLYKCKYLILSLGRVFSLRQHEILQLRWPAWLRQTLEDY